MAGGGGLPGESFRGGEGDLAAAPLAGGRAHGQGFSDPLSSDSLRANARAEAELGGSFGGELVAGEGLFVQGRREGIDPYGRILRQEKDRFDLVGPDAPCHVGGGLAGLQGGGVRVRPAGGAGALGSPPEEARPRVALDEEPQRLGREVLHRPLAVRVILVGDARGLLLEQSEGEAGRLRHGDVCPQGHPGGAGMLAEGRMPGELGEAPAGSVQEAHPYLRGIQQGGERFLGLFPLAAQLGERRGAVALAANLQDVHRTIRHGELEIGQPGLATDLLDLLAFLVDAEGDLAHREAHRRGRRRGEEAEIHLVPGADAQGRAGVVGEEGEHGAIRSAGRLGELRALDVEGRFPLPAVEPQDAGQARLVPVRFLDEEGRGGRREQPVRPALAQGLPLLGLSTGRQGGELVVFRLKDDPIRTARDGLRAPGDELRGLPRGQAGEVEPRVRRALHEEGGGLLLPGEQEEDLVRDLLRFSSGEGQAPEPSPCGVEDLGAVEGEAGHVVVRRGQGSDLPGIELDAVELGRPTGLEVMLLRDHVRDEGLASVLLLGPCHDDGSIGGEGRPQGGMLRIPPFAEVDQEVSPEVEEPHVPVVERPGLPEERLVAVRGDREVPPGSRLHAVAQGAAAVLSLGGLGTKGGREGRRRFRGRRSRGRRGSRWDFSGGREGAGGRRLRGATRGQHPNDHPSPEQGSIPHHGADATCHPPWRPGAAGRLRRRRWRGPSGGERR
jgi:hypothetical protein